MKYPDICSYIRQLQQSRGLTLHDLSRLLGYSSPTSLTRLMQASANRASLQQFADRLRACSAMHLTRRESIELDDLIELHDIGEDYGTMISLRRLLRGEPVDTQPPVICDPQGNCCSFLPHMASRRIRRMLLINGELLGLFNDLALLMEQGGFPVEHYLYSGTTAMHTVRSVRATLPMLHSPRYNSYTYRINLDPTTTTRGLIMSDMMIYDYTAEDGREQSEIIVFTTPFRGELLQTSTCVADFGRLLPPRSEMRPIFQHVRCADLLEYNRLCMELEQDRLVCAIKSDLCIAHLPLQVLRQAILDHAGLALQGLRQEMEQTFMQRQHNMLNKAAPQYHILRRGAMQRFAATGLLSDNLLLCRPFTMAERVMILRFLRQTFMNSKNFHMCFLKDDESLRCDEIVFFADRGLSISKPDTSVMDLSGDAEILITDPDLLKVFKRFIFESTLRYRVDSEDDARAFIDQLISECEAQL